jgi:hypothetical protein
MDQNQGTREPSTDDIAAAAPAAGQPAGPASAGGIPVTERSDRPTAPDQAQDQARDDRDRETADTAALTDRDRETADTAALTDRGRGAAAVTPADSGTPVDAETIPADTDAGATRETAAPLLPAEASTQLQSRWREIQTRFVDDPREAVSAADGLVAELMQTLASGFAERRHALESQWQRGEDVGTEELRVVLQQYRAFFDRLLSA